MGKATWESKYGPINEDYRGDFIGFTWDGMSMSRLNVIRTSNGNRFNENLLATMQDKTNQIPGNDGTYYFGSWYTAKPFSIQIAFEKLTELQIRQLRQLFGDKEIHRLSFDEQPYKEYLVKCTGTPQLKYIPFDDEVEDTETEITDIYSPGPAGQWRNRIYKGEGTLTFTAYCPYARARATDLETLHELDEDVYFAFEEGAEQWESAEVLPPTAIRALDSNYTIDLNNCGDTPTDFILIFENFLEIEGRKITLSLYKSESEGESKEKIDELTFEIDDRYDSDEKLRINSKAELIEGLDNNGKITGNLYNDSIDSGRFFKIPTNENSINLAITSTNAEGKDTTVSLKGNINIEYTYWYY